MSPEIISALLQIPVVAALIYLVLALEDRRQDAMRMRDETFLRIVESLLGLIDEFAAQQMPGKLSAKQLKNIKDYLDHRNGGKT